jgi:hypothetical protein
MERKLVKSGKFLKAGKWNTHGIISMLLMLDATTVALISIAQQSKIMAGVYFLFFLAFLFIVAKFYCSKCLCRENCNHLIIGWMSQKMSKKKYGSYTTRDLIFGVILPFLPILIIPQFYLYHNIFYLLLYWGLFGIAAVEINIYVCKGCRNTKCSMCRQNQY